MSAGAFTSEFYELDTVNGGGIVNIRVQPETLLADIDGVANSPPSGPATLPITASVGGGKREFGVNARSVTLEFTGAIPDGYSGDNVRIPVLQEATASTWTKGKTGTYLDVPVRVAGTSRETVN